VGYRVGGGCGGWGLQGGGGGNPGLGFNGEGVVGRWVEAGGGGVLTRVLLLIGSVLCEGPEADSWLRAVRLQLSFILFLFVWFLVFSV